MPRTKREYKTIIKTLIKVDPASQYSNYHYGKYKRTIGNHLKKLGFKYHKVSSWPFPVFGTETERYKISLIFYITINYDLDNMVKRFVDILCPFLNINDVNVWELKAKKLYKKSRQSPRIKVIIKKYFRGLHEV